MKNKKFIIAVIIIILAVVLGVRLLSKNGKPEFETARVEIGNVVQEVSETGKVIEGEAIDLSFKNSGQIKKISVAIGDKVKTGDILAELDTSNLYIQLQGAKSALAISQAQLNKLLAGVTQEEIQAAQTKVDNASISLNEAKQTLEDVYDDSLNSLDDAYLKAYNSFIVVDTIQRTYFIGSDQESVKVKEKKDEINSLTTQIKVYLDTAKASSEDAKKDLALSETKKYLNTIFSDLGIVRETCESENYRNTVSSTNKTYLDTQRTNINTALTTVTTSQQTISSAKLSIESTEGLLQVAEDNLALLTASPRQEDIDLYKAQVSQAKSQVQIIEKQMQDSILRSPVDGKITDIKKRVGEMAQAIVQDVAFILLPDSPFEIKVDIYEEDVVKLNMGNLVDISLVSLPDKIFRGKVISIDPSEKLIEGVVYYETTISFDEMPEGIKPGMTADVIIKTASRENVLTIPKGAIQEKDGRVTVEVLNGKSTQQKEIKIGLKGSNDLIEVVSGLGEGEEVIVQ